jgi:acetyl esterase/lipase
MRTRNAGLAIWLALAMACGSCARAGPISFSDLLARPRAAPTRQIAYGPAPEQFAQLWSPDSKGPHPVVVMIHGGCWLASLPGVELMAYVSEDLRRRGFAVWNIEYRRVGGTGGGYPGTFEDVGRAIDHLRVIAGAENLDLRHVVLVGHSAGGHLAIWAAARRRVSKGDPLFSPNPLPIAGVVSLAGIDDLAAYRASGPDACGGPDTIDQLVDARGRRGQDVYADTSPAALVPIGARQAILSGALDPIVPARFGLAYADKARAAGDKVQVMDIPAAGHFELIDPTSKAWKRIEPAIEAMLK